MPHFEKSSHASHSRNKLKNVRKRVRKINHILLVFIGELGASDGSDGLYDYLVNGGMWNLMCREMLDCSVDLLGGPCEKELFIFQSVL